MNRSRVLIVDDHQLVAEGIQLLIRDDYEVLEILQDGRQLVDAGVSLQPDLILADITMPGLNGIDACKNLRTQGCESKVIFLTMHQDALYARRALNMGASGFVLKHSASKELLEAMQTVLNGGIYISPTVEPMLRCLPESTQREARCDSVLTPRQREVLQLFAEGHSARETAAILSISVRTAENHKAQIMAQLGVNSTADLVRSAIRHGLIGIS
jgi:DNA-binding NarL/FixJ family response regulator